jgi:S-adenosylmethionine:tRNA ribosyltransferase-isomerase
VVSTQHASQEVNAPVLRSELHYDLPPELIAQSPAERRDASRLLVLDRRTGRVHHEQVARLPDLLPPRAVLVFNDTRVLPARLKLVRPTGGRLEGLFLHEREPGLWELMLTGAGRVKAGETLRLESASQTFLTAEQRLILVERLEGGAWTARPEPAGQVVELLGRYGLPPLPPYILKAREGESRKSKVKSRHAEVGDRSSDALTQPVGQQPIADPSEDSSLMTHHSSLEDVTRYQTVYARNPGAVAAPTAGLHFTPELLDTLRGRGFETHFVTLHVGVGTFAPIRAEDLADHGMHQEWYECSETVADAVNRARGEGRAIVAVGTTSVRVLETCAVPPGDAPGAGSSKSRGRNSSAVAEPARSPEHDERCAAPTIRAGSGWTRLFIYPPYEFKVVDAMITNFHLPESTLLAMIFAFASRERVLSAYQEAIRERYRFYSYGDPMLLL